MTLKTLVKQIEQEYYLKSIAQTRYSALNKVVNFLNLLEKENDNILAIDLLKEVDKKEFKKLYLHYKITQLQLSEKLTGAENQAINDIYKKIK